MSTNPDTSSSIPQIPLPSRTQNTPNRADSGDGLTWIHFSNAPLRWAEAEAVCLLGGKGLSLSLLNRAGISTPPAATILTTACQYYHSHGRQWPIGLWEDVRAAVTRLEIETGRTFGYGTNPLTLAVRSGAAVSMPGLMNTFLHCGLSKSLVRKLNQDSVWNSFAEFLDNESLLRLVGVDSMAMEQFRQEKHIQSRSGKSLCEHVLSMLDAAGCSELLDNPEALLRLAITGVWDSWDGPGVRQFLALRGDKQAVGTAVTIQAMFQSELSGIAFSQNPVTLLRGIVSPPAVGSQSQKSTCQATESLGDSLKPTHGDTQEIVIEAIPGLGRALVGGQATPVRWSVNRTALIVQQTSLPETLTDQHCLGEFEEKHILRLCETVLKIESLYEAPVDVEFGFGQGELVVFQARPIAREAVSPTREHVRQFEREKLLQRAAQGDKLWVRHNLAETLAAPTPLTWDLWREFMNGSGGYGRLYRRLGYRPTTAVSRDGFLELIAGRIYANPQRLTEMICQGYPLTFDSEVLRTDPNAINRPPSQFDLNRLTPWFLFQWPFLALRAVRSNWIRHRLAQQAATEFDQQLVPRLVAFIESERQLELQDMALGELMTIFERRCHRIFDEFAPQILLPGTLGIAAWSTLEQKLRPILGDAECSSLLNQWSLQIADPIAKRQEELFRKLALPDSTLDDFLREFGHRGPAEMDLSAPRWREIPDNLRAMAESHGTPPWPNLQDPVHQSTKDLLRLALERNGASCLYRELLPLLDQALRLLPYREIGKHQFLKIYELIRDVVTLLSQRLSLNDRIHFLTIQELRSLTKTTSLTESKTTQKTTDNRGCSAADIGGSIIRNDATPRQIMDELSKRREFHRLCQQLEVPSFLEIVDDLRDFGRLPHRVLQGRVLHGKSLSFGQVSGRVQLLKQGEFSLNVTPNSVLVATSIDPGMIPLMVGAAGFVVEQGGLLSHVALLARQFSIPALVVPEITRCVSDGEAIRVDADHELVEFPERPA